MTSWISFRVVLVRDNRRIFLSNEYEGDRFYKESTFTSSSSSLPQCMINFCNALSMRTNVLGRVFTLYHPDTLELTLSLLYAFPSSIVVFGP